MRLARSISARSSFGAIAPTTLLGDLILQFEDVVERAFEAIGPEMRPGCRVDQLPGDADAVGGLADAAFQHIAHAQLAADLLHVHGAALVGEA